MHAKIIISLAGTRESELESSVPFSSRKIRHGSSGDGACLRVYLHRRCIFADIDPS